MALVNLKNRMTTRQSVIASCTEDSILEFLDTAVTRKSGKVVLAIVLYAMFINRTSANVPAKRFFRILDQHGYRSRREIGGDIFENLTFTS